MKYLRKFESVQPIDVDLDIEEFWNTFGQKIKDYDEKNPKYKREPDLRSRLDKLTQEFGYTMTDDYRYYDICEVDDYGRCQYNLITVRAVNKEHAKLKAAIKRKNLDIFTTGFYSAKEVDIRKEISSIESQIDSLQKKLEELKRIS